MSLSQFETDEQRAEAIIDWLKSNALFLILTVVIVVGGVFGWHYYQDNKVLNLSTQAKHYYQFNHSLKEGEWNEKAYENVMSDKNAPGLRDLAVLNKVSYENSQKDNSQLVGDLTNQLKNIQNPVMKDLYRYRLAKIQLEAKAYDAAIAELNNITTESYKNLAKILQGDIYAAEGRVDNALAVYTEAYDQTEDPYILRKINQLQKLSNN